MPRSPRLSNKMQREDNDNDDHEQARRYPRSSSGYGAVHHRGDDSISLQIELPNDMAVLLTVSCTGSRGRGRRFAVIVAMPLVSAGCERAELQTVPLPGILLKRAGGGAMLRSHFGFAVTTQPRPVRCGFFLCGFEGRQAVCPRSG
jgi:hypothetical protein